MHTFSGYRYSAKAYVITFLIISVLTVSVESQNSAVQEGSDSTSILDILRQGRKLTSQNTAVQNTPSVQDILRKGQTLRLGSAVEQNSEPDLMNKMRQKFKILLGLLEAQNKNRKVTDVRTPVNLNFASFESTPTHGNTPIFSAEPKSENSQSPQGPQPTGNFEFSLGLIPPQGPQSVLTGPPKLNNQEDFPQPPPPQIPANKDQLEPLPDVPIETTSNQEQSNDIVLPDGTVLHSTSEDVPLPLEMAPPPTPPPINILLDTPPFPDIDITLDSPPMP